MTKQREAIVNLLDPIVGPAYASNAPEAADAVIQYLWQRADDPEVVEAVERACHGMSRWSNDEFIPGMWEDNANVIGEALLTALLGPKPNGEEADDGDSD